MYEEIATNAISGGYNRTEGVEHYYKGDTNDTIDQKALQYYQQFADAIRTAIWARLSRNISMYCRPMISRSMTVWRSSTAVCRGDLT